MRADFYRPEEPEDVLGSATWSEDGVDARSDDGQVQDALRRIFRPVPAVVDDPSLRSFGTAGPLVFQPGSLRWFQAAARSRASAEGLAVRLVDEEQNAMGWDPAGAYRPFMQAIERKTRIGGEAFPAGPRRGQPAT